MSQYVCMRCTRQLMRQQSSRVRSISNTASNNAAYRDLSQSPTGSENDAPGQPRKQSAFGAMIDRAQANPEEGRSAVTKYTVYSGGIPPARRSDGQPRNLPISRAGGPPRGDFAGRGRGGGPPAGQLLRRRAPSSSVEASQQQAGGRSLRGGAAQRGRGRGGRKDRPQRRKDDGEADTMDPQDEAEIEEQMFGGPLTPKDPVPYNPRQMSNEDFQADWPNTPMSVSGLVGSVQQKVEVLARRLPHGYISPDHLAERFQRGDLVRFESGEEKEKVLAKAAELAKARSDMLTERKGENVPADDMTFSSIEKMEGKELANKMGRGVYPELEKQRIPFLDTVMRNLRNNGTYHDSKQEEFMAKIASLLPQPGAGKGARQQKKTG